MPKSLVERRSWMALAAMLVLQLWLAHAVGFFVHEYAHSFTAWVLGWKANPLALHYGHLDAANLLMMIDIDENVDYGPIFAAGRGATASLIAVAGVLIGDGLLYLVARWLLARFARGGSLFFYWLVVMSVGNFLCYVPVRTFTTSADMGTFARGLSLSPWVVLLLLGTPFGIAVWQFFRTLMPRTLARLFPEDLLRQRTFVGLTTLVVFVYFGAAGFEHGLPAACVWMSRVSWYVCFPLVTILCWPTRSRLLRRANAWS